MNKNLAIRFSFLICIAFCTGCEADNKEFTVMFESSARLFEPYGLCTHINRKGEGWEFDGKEKEMKMVSETGANFIRTDFDWGYCQPLKDNPFTFNYHDEMMGCVESQHLKTLGILSPIGSEKYDKWFEYVDTTVGHFKQQVIYWEVINEADRWHLRYPNFCPKDYVRIICDAYPLIKKKNKYAKVLLTSISDISGKFFEDILDSGVTRFCDIMNFHFYVNSNTEPEYLFKYFNEIKSILDKHDIRKPVWFTETGCTTAKGYADEETQAKRLPRVFLISFACGIEKVFWYKTRAAERSDHFEDHFGIWHKDYSPKPAFYAYKTLVDMCPSKSTRPRIRRQGDVYIATWKQPKGTYVTALWTSKGKEVVQINQFEGYIYDIHGRVLTQSSNDLYVTPSIIYFVSKKKQELSFKV